MANRFSLAADIKPTVDERAAEREADELAGTFEDRMGNIAPGVDGGGVAGRGGAGGGGIGGAAGATGLTSILKGGAGGLAKVALGGAVGFGILQGIQKVSQASPSMQQTSSMFSDAMNLFFRPFGNFLSGILRPAAMAMLKMGISFNEHTGENGLLVGIGAFSADALSSFAGAVGDKIGNAIDDIMSGDISPITDMIIDSYKTAAPWIWMADGFVQELTGQSISDYITGTISLSKDVFSGAIGLGQWMWDGAIDLGEWLFSGAIDLGEWLFSGAIDLGKWLFSGAISLGKWLWNGSISLGRWLFNGAIGLGQWLFDGAIGLGDWMFDDDDEVNLRKYIDVPEIDLGNFITIPWKDGDGVEEGDPRDCQEIGDNCRSHSDCCGTGKCCDGTCQRSCDEGNESEDGKGGGGDHAECVTDDNCPGSQICRNGMCGPPPGSPGGCFPAGTPVQTPYGTKPIENIQPDDQVVSCDTQTGDIVTSTVGERVVHTNGEHDFAKFPLTRLHLAVDGDVETTITTANHRYLVSQCANNRDPDDARWKHAGNLQPGDVLRADDGQIEVLMVRAVEETPPEAIYNLHMKSGPPTFLADGVVVHNQGKQSIGGPSGEPASGTMGTMSTTGGTSTMDDIKKGMDTMTREMKKTRKAIEGSADSDMGDDSALDPF